LHEPPDEAAAAALYKELEQNPAHTAARVHLAGWHRRCSQHAAEAGDETAAHQHFRAAIALQPVIVWPYRGTAPAQHIIEFRSAIARDANTNTGGLFDPATFATTTIYLEYWNPEQPFPLHRAVFNAISDADAAGPALRVAELFARRTSARVFNPPERIAPTGRLGNAHRLGAIPGVRTPRIAAVSRDALEWAESPVLLRAPGFHNGRYFELVESPSQLGAALERIPGETLWTLEFIDTRDAAGYFRKYRVMTIGGTLYPLHLAVSKHWKVHYFSSEMSEHPEHRAEEASFLADMQAALGTSVMRALHEIDRVQALDYGGIDFTIDRDGKVVVFEANATMAVLSPSDDPIWDYRRPAIERVKSAVTGLLLSS
jgi:hypothetical protein